MENCDAKEKGKPYTANEKRYDKRKHVRKRHISHRGITYF